MYNIKRCVDIEHRQAMRLAPAIGFSHFPYASIAWTGSMGLILSLIHISEPTRPY